LGDRDILFFLAAIILGVTFLAGFYPAIVVSGFNPITALKNKLMIRQTSGISLRRGLVVFQFCIAQVLVIGTLVIVSQMDYFKNHSLGFNKDAVLTVPIPNDSLSLTKLPVVRNQLMQLPGVKDVSFSYATPSDDGNWLMNFKYNNSDKKTDFYASFKWADADYFRLYGIKFIAGRPYDRTDQVKGYVVNETLLKKLGVRDPKDAIGKFINVWNDKTKYAPIVGVVKDFNISSLRDKIPPVVMASWTDSYGTISVKLQPSNLNISLAGVEKVWNSSFPAYVYSFQFLDDKIAKFYEHDQQLSMLYRLFAGIAIFISCLGLYGLVSFMTVQRNKEVGIRKVLGASVSHIVYLFSKEFTMLVLVAFVAAAPIGWYLMNKWLQGYSYKITLGPGIFILVIIISITIAWITVGYKAVKAALANPVKSLRSE
jgi:ABC-type antimicrobial peptide transport system permease subunit